MARQREADLDLDLPSAAICPPLRARRYRALPRAKRIFRRCHCLGNALLQTSRISDCAAFSKSSASLVALRQTRRFVPPLTASGLRPTADITHRDRYFRKVSTTDHAPQQTRYTISSSARRSGSNQNNRAVRHPHHVKQIWTSGSERASSCFTQTDFAVDEEAAPQSLGTAARTKPRHRRALKPSAGSWFSHELRSR